MIIVLSTFFSQMSTINITDLSWQNLIKNCMSLCHILRRLTIKANTTYWFINKNQEFSDTGNSRYNEHPGSIGL
jgi:hypothetical protein